MFGLKSACDLVREHCDPSKPQDFGALLDAVMKLPNVPENFRQQFANAYDVFRYQPVFSRATDEAKNLNPAPAGRDMSHIGICHDNDVAKKVADGDLEASSRKPWNEVLEPEYNEYDQKKKVIHDNMTKAMQLYQTADNSVLDALIEKSFSDMRAYIEERRRKDPRDPIVRIQEKYEAEFARKEKALIELCTDNNLAIPEKQEVLRWVAALYLEEMHDKDVGSYGLKEMPDEHGVPQRNEELATLIEKNRNIMYTLKCGDEEGTHWPINLINQTGMPSTGHEKVESTYYPYFQSFNGRGGERGGMLSWLEAFCLSQKKTTTLSRNNQVLSPLLLPCLWLIALH